MCILCGPCVRYRGAESTRLKSFTSSIGLTCRRARRGRKRRFYHLVCAYLVQIKKSRTRDGKRSRRYDVVRASFVTPPLPKKSDDFSCRKTFFPPLVNRSAVLRAYCTHCVLSYGLGAVFFLVPSTRRRNRRTFFLGLPSSPKSDGIRVHSTRRHYCMNHYVLRVDRSQYCPSRTLVERWFCVVDGRI